MTGHGLIELFREGNRRCHVIGTLDQGVIAGLDLEGRLFAVVGGKVVNRVNPEAFTGVTDGARYLNPGGDGLWPAPEGTALGFVYATGTWRVPPGLSGARYKVVEQRKGFARIRAEVDLVNNGGMGLPTVFERAIRVSTRGETVLIVSVTESIQYVGSRVLTGHQALLAPWTLCQFDCGEGTEVIFPAGERSAFWDFYAPSTGKQYQRNDLWHTRTDGGPRYQLGMDRSVDWLEYVDPRQGLTVRRTAGSLPEGQSYIDIADAPPDGMPSDKGTRFSVYSDSALFMEMEACGGCPETLTPGCTLSVEVETTYTVTPPVSCGQEHA